MHHVWREYCSASKAPNYWKPNVKSVEFWSDEMSRDVTDGYRLYRPIGQYAEVLRKQATNQLLMKIVASLPFGSVYLEM